MAQCLIKNYRNLPGEHCGSTAMRNLLFHYCGLDLSEDVVFGLGSGADCVLIECDRFAPGILLLGRGPTLEVDVTDALGIDYSEEAEFDDADAWQVVRGEVEEGRPTMLSGDVLYLDYRDFKVHFPAHRFVLLGYDDERQVAFVADRLDPETQECSYAALAESRNPKDFISTYNTWGRFAGSAPQSGSRELGEAFKRAIAKNAARMVGADSDRVRMFESLTGGRPAKLSVGLDALSRLVDVMEGLAGHAKGREIARYAASCIESFGTGGGNFRNLYAGFLSEARRHVPELVAISMPQQAADAAALWTALSEQLRTFSKSGDRAALDDAPSTAAKIRNVEAGLFETLATASGR